jgi:hypothetical protein
MNLVELY